MKTEDRNIKEIKVYNIIYHYLRAMNQKAVASPSTNTRQIDYFLACLRDTERYLELRSDEIGGLSIEITVEARSHVDALLFVEEANAFNIEEYFRPNRVTGHG